MAARSTGELTFHAHGANWIMVFDFNALCEIEDVLDLSISELQGRLQAPRMTMIRTIFRVGLSRHHAGMTDQKAGEIIGALGMQRAAALIGEAFAAAFPAETAEVAGSTARPLTSA